MVNGAVQHVPSMWWGRTYVTNGTDTYFSISNAIKTAPRNVRANIPKRNALRVF